MMFYVITAVLVILGCVSSSVVEKTKGIDFNGCGIKATDRTQCGIKGNTLDKQECLARSCCYDETDHGSDVAKCFYPKRMLSQECMVEYENKDDCGYYGITEAECIVRGCCFKPNDRPNDPICYYKANKQPIDIDSLMIDP